MDQKQKLSDHSMETTYSVHLRPENGKDRYSESKSIVSTHLAWNKCACQNGDKEPPSLFPAKSSSRTEAAPEE